MSLLIIMLAIATGAIGYLVTGYCIFRNRIAGDISDWLTLRPSPSERKIRDLVREELTMTTLLWPLRILFEAIDAFSEIIRGHASKIAETHDPHAARQREREQQEYIRKLERELGIGHIEGGQ